MAEATSTFERVSRWIGGIEQVRETGLPVEEFAHPLPLLSMVLLGVNDHLLKGSGWVPGWLTGKLSDFAGLFFFPLFVTAALDTVLYALFRLSRGRTPDYSLTMGKLWGAVIFTAILFVPLNLSEAWGRLYIRLLHVLDFLDLFGNFAVTLDYSDLVAVAMFPVVILFGRRFVRRIPLGRLNVLRVRVTRASGDERRQVLERGLRDVRRLVGEREAARSALDRFERSFGESLDEPTSEQAATQAQQDLDAFRKALERPA